MGNEDGKIPMGLIGVSIDPENTYKFDLSGKDSPYREYGIRKGIVLPDKSDPEEMRWAREGPVPFSRLETLKRPIPSGDK